jgi:hypothetical protein
MNISNSKDFYILIEGEPESPEVNFLIEVIDGIFKHNNIPFLPIVIEVGGSSSFKSFAKFCYRDSEVHANIPVLALSDSDYRTSLDKKQSQNSHLIKNKNPKIIYWKRLEWENYLLDETRLIADLINQLPNKTKAKVGKPYKQNSETVSKEDIDIALLNYFQTQVKNEFWECLKFNFSLRQVKKYPSIKELDNFEGQTLSDIENWFLKESEKIKGVCEFKKRPSNLFQTIMEEFDWEQLINSPHILTFEHAKKYFRGKEALDYVYEFIKEKVNFQNLSKQDLKREILCKLMDSTQSSIYYDLENLLQTELLN